MPQHEHELEQLPNLGKTTLMWLRAIGIRTADSLAKKGIYWAYVGMQQRGFRVTNAVLFSLAGALRDVPWRSLSDEEKQTLLAGLAAFEEHSAGANLTTHALPKRAPRRSAAPSARGKRQGALDNQLG